MCRTLDGEMALELTAETFAQAWRGWARVRVDGREEMTHRVPTPNAPTARLPANSFSFGDPLLAPRPTPRRRGALK